MCRSLLTSRRSAGPRITYHSPDITVFDPLEGRQNGERTNVLMGWGSKAEDRASWWSAVAERFYLVDPQEEATWLLWGWSLQAVPRCAQDVCGSLGDPVLVLTAVQKLRMNN